MSAVGKAKYSVVTDIGDIKERYEEKTTIICSNDYYALKAYFKSSNVKVVGFDNIKAIDKYKIAIDSVGYSVAEIANAAVDIIRCNEKESVIVKHFIAEHTV